MGCVGDTGHMVGSRHWFGQRGGLGRVRERGCDRLLPLLRRKKKETRRAYIKIKATQIGMNPTGNEFMRIGNYGTESRTLC